MRGSLEEKKMNRAGAFMEDAFSSCHPLINFIFFIGAVLCGMFFTHPAFLAASAILSALYYLLLNGSRGASFILKMAAFVLLIAVLNGVFNARGSTVLFTWISGRHFTLEALLYGFAVGGMFFTVICWFACYNKIMTSDKFTYLFGKISPAVSLVFCMVLRFVPSFQKKAGTISDARRCIGMSRKGGTKKEKLAEGMTVLSVMTSWALENSQETAESMQSRGYGSGKRTQFSIWRFRTRDRILLAIMAICLIGLFVCAYSGGMKMKWIPSVRFPEKRELTESGLVFYSVFLGIPPFIDMGEKVTWRFLRSKI
jgi:energy-coupling factor transport system permease protein